MGQSCLCGFKETLFHRCEEQRVDPNLNLLPIKIRVCIDYRKLNAATHKDYFSLSFIDQMLERLAGHGYYYFLDGYSAVSYTHLTLPTKRIV